ncbi:START domain-containing protein [Spirosoma luteum]|uniref:START domain-containing protein n=1 Tax=Spirosoma luteum TaxID=431553 RepID=UPI0003650239|nr:START domain-containing protein [Spirosoma luteum]
MVYKFFMVISMIVAITFNAATSTTCFSQSSEGWKLEKDKNGIKVYTRKAANSSIMEFRASATVAAHMEQLEALIEKVNDYPGWQTSISTANVLKQQNKEEQYIYYTTDVPWPVTDRDIVLHSEKNKSASGIVTYNLHSKPDFISEKGNFVRIKKAKGFWQFTPFKDNKINVTFQFYADPEGNIPDWIINMFLVKGPYNSLTNLKSKVEKL